MPGGHWATVALVLRLGQAYPAAQGPLQAGDDRPELAPYRPGMQSVQDAVPPVENVPGGHRAAVALVEPVTHAKPEVHGPLQPADVRPTVAPYLPPGQGPLQDAVVSPRESPYRPAGQSVHTPAPARLYLPAGQMEAVADTLPSGQAYPGWHGPLHAAVVRPEALPYRPAAQAVQAPAPPVENLPAGHATAVAMEEAGGQAYPAAQGPEQVAVDNPMEAP